MSKPWWTPREFNAEASPEKVCQEGLAKLDAEQHRHQEEMKRLKEEHEEQMKKLNDSTFNQARNWFYKHIGSKTVADLFGYNSSGVVTEDKKVGENSFGVSSSADGPGTCLIIWNESHSNETEAHDLSQAFQKLDFAVEFKKNLSERETWNLFEIVANAKYQDKKCFILAFISKGTPEYMKSNDGKKMKLSKIVDFFSPYNAIGLRRTPKLFFFQCDGENKGEKMWKHDEPPFAPKYHDAFVYCSTHRRLLSTLKDFLGKRFVGEFEGIMSKVSDELVKDSTAQESIAMVSTLRNELFFGEK